MYNLQKYSFVFLVLLLQLKTLVSLPLEGQLNPAAPSQPSVNLSTASDVSSGVAARSANVSEGSPSLRSGFESVQSANLSSSNLNLRSALESGPSANISADASLPATRIEPEPLVNPSVNVAVRSSFELNAPVAQAPAANSPSIEQRSAFNVQQVPSNASVGVSAPALRSGFADSLSNNSHIQERSQNFGLNNTESEIAARAANSSQPELRTGFDLPAPANSSNAGNDSGHFVPSFFKSFGLRRKRNEDLVSFNISDNNAPVARLLPSEGTNASVNLTVRSNFEQPSLVGSNNPAPVAPQLSTNVDNTSSNVNIRSGLELVPNANSAAVPQVNTNPEQAPSAIVVENEPAASANLEPAASSSVIIPYINVYPLETVV